MKQFSVKLILTAVMLLLTFPAMAEFVFMKDGKIHEGKILSETADDIIFKTKEGKTINLPMKQVLRTLYANLNMAKLYIQKRNGESFVAYLVDEDRDVYRFRKELYKPEEFAVPRKDVLFMSEKNPSALKGDPSSDSIKLSWLPPYGQVKVYKIYMKPDKLSEYKVIGTTKSNNLTITGLKTQTTYFFIVRAVDDTDYETNPSNEIQVITKSTLPEAPDVTAKKDEKANWVVMWEGASDKDGKVEGYRIYIEKDGKYSLLEETKKQQTVVPSASIFDSVHVRSVDNNGDESEPDEYRNEWRVLLSPQYCIPVAKTTDFMGNGYGINFDVSKRDMLFNDSEFGVSGGYMTAEGKEKIGEGNSNVTSLTMYPVSLFFAYRFPVIFDRFDHYDIISVFPKISAGALIMQMDYELLDNAGNVDETKSATVFEPFIKAGIFTEFGVSRHFFFIVGSEFTYMIDSVQGLGIINLSAAAGVRF